jgi:hypothetical protein
MLRHLTELPGRPLTVVGCHPAQQATNDNMIPRGGSAFMCELDGNLTSIVTGNVAEMHWAGKFRGPDFEPISFEVSSITSDKLRDSKGRNTWTAMARAIGSERQAKLEDEARSNQDQVLLVLDQSPDYSLAQIANALAWVNNKGQPLRAKVQRAMDTLKRSKLADTELGKWTLTKKGKARANRLRERAK